jgi:hypothetical protein
MPTEELQKEEEKGERENFSIYTELIKAEDGKLKSSFSLFRLSRFPIKILKGVLFVKNKELHRINYLYARSQ